MSKRPVDLKRGLAAMLKGGVIMDVVTPEQAVIAEEAGACAVMALERIPADIRASGGVARMSDPDLIASIAEAVSIPVMAKCRIGHVTEARMLEAMGIDFIDESEVLTPADPTHHLDKSDYQAPFVCGAVDLGQALRRIHEGAAMIRTKGEAGTGNIIEAVRHARAIQEGIDSVKAADASACDAMAQAWSVPVSLLHDIQQTGRLPVVNFAAGGIATPADAALMMTMGSDGVFVGSGIFKSSQPAALAQAMVQAVTHYQDPKRLVELSRHLGQAMPGVLTFQR